MRGSHLLPSQLPGEHTGHEAASRHSEPIWNAHIPPITLIAGTHFTYPGRDGRPSQPVECSTAGPSHESHYGATPAGQSPIHVFHPCINRAHDCLTSVIKRNTFAPCYVSPSAYSVEANAVQFRKLSWPLAKSAKKD